MKARSGRLPQAVTQLLRGAVAAPVFDPPSQRVRAELVTVWPGKRTRLNETPSEKLTAQNLQYQGFLGWAAEDCAEVNGAGKPVGVFEGDPVVLGVDTFDSLQLCTKLHHVSLQGTNPSRLPCRLRVPSRVAQLTDVQVAPLLDQLMHTLGKPSGKHFTRPDLHDGAILPILGVEVRRIVVVVKHLDEYPEEGRKDRHTQASAHTYSGPPSRSTAEQAEGPAAVRRIVSETKKFVTEAAWDVANLAMQITGGVGYTDVYPIERVVRDAMHANDSEKIFDDDDMWKVYDQQK
jgi:hypothetical protein